jgi:hypothetical protein
MYLRFAPKYYERSNQYYLREMQIVGEANMRTWQLTTGVFLYAHPFHFCPLIHSTYSSGGAVGEHRAVIVRVPLGYHWGQCVACELQM